MKYRRQKGLVLSSYPYGILLTSSERRSAVKCILKYLVLRFLWSLAPFPLAIFSPSLLSKGFYGAAISWQSIKPSRRHVCRHLEVDTMYCEAGIAAAHTSYLSNKHHSSTTPPTPAPLISARRESLLHRNREERIHSPDSSCISSSSLVPANQLPMHAILGRSPWIQRYPSPLHLINIKKNHKERK